MNPRSDDTRVTLLGWCVASAALTLIAATWRLWTRQDDFPQVPFFAWGVRTPPWVDWIAASVLVLSFAAVLVAGGRSRWRTLGFLGAATGFLGLILLDQHRFQPWAYQFVLMAIVLATCSPTAALRWLRVLTIGIYFHSALSKLDESFYAGTGQQFLEALVAWGGLSIAEWSPAVRRLAAAAFAWGELAIASGLCVPQRRVRYVALGGSLVMHAVMLLILGPWGLGHRPGVLLWNAFFMVQNVILFAPPRKGSDGRVAAGDQAASHPAPSAGRAASRRRLTTLVGPALVAAAVSLPLLEPFGYFDLWPAWGLYASHGERFTFRIAAEARRALPAEVAAFLVPDPADDAWLVLRIDRWSLASVGAPVYPQNRFHLGVALAVIDRSGLREEEVRATWESRASRHETRRARRELVGATALRAAAAECRWNAWPRRR